MLALWGRVRGQGRGELSAKARAPGSLNDSRMCASARVCTCVHVSMHSVCVCVRTRVHGRNSQRSESSLKLEPLNLPADNCHKNVAAGVELQLIWL